MEKSYGETLLMNEKYREYILATMTHKWNWLEGSIRSAKSVMNALAFALYLETTPDKVHLVIASTVSSAREIVEDGDGRLGLRQYFGSRYRSGKYKDLACGYINTPTGEKIVVYVGGSLANSYTKFRGWSIGGVEIEELDLLHENTIQEARNRIVMAADPKVFISHNPTNPNHPIYRWLADMQEKGIVNYMHTTLSDNPAISPERIREIASEYDPASVQYRRYILGERVVAENLIYNVAPDDIISDFDPKDYSSYILVADPGMTQSATAFILAAYNRKMGSLDILRSYHHRNADEKNKNSHKTQAQYAQDFIAFLRDCRAMMGFSPSLAIVDSFDGADFYYALVGALRDQGERLLVKFPIDSEGNERKEEMATRIAMGCSLLYRKKLRFYEGCKDVISDFETAQYDPDKLQKGIETRMDDFSSSGHLDELDAVEYAFAFYRKQLM
jgi:PBSX family phage terminase large subunit